MHNGDGKPRFVSIIWPLAVVVVALDVKTNSIVTDMVMLMFSRHPIWSDMHSRE